MKKLTLLSIFLTAHYLHAVIKPGEVSGIETNSINPETIVPSQGATFAASGYGKISGTSPQPNQMTDPPVSVSKKGDKVILSNGILTATINAGAGISSLIYNGREMCSSIYYSMDGGTNYRTPGGGDFSVKTDTPDLVDVGFKQRGKDEPQHMDCEIHYVLKRGDSGIYSYAILSHPTDYPGGGYGEWRFVWKHPEGLFENIYVDDSRHWSMPTERDFKNAQPTAIKEITKLTSGLWAGKYDCKYDYSVSYHDIGCWGHASDRNRVGQWMILGGYDYLNDGPTKQDLSAAHGYVLVHFGRDHYNGSTVTVPSGQFWEKIFGPFLIYCNSSEQGADGCWADAKGRVAAEKAVWPYTWMTDTPLYPSVSKRGAIIGHLVIKDEIKPGFKPTNTWIGLANPPSLGNWQFDSMGYQYWEKTDSGGNFTISNVRSGTYTLYAFTDGAVGEYSQANIRVEAGKTNNLGAVIWSVPHKGKSIAWEIGIPDRTSKEFRHGMDAIRDYVWENFQSEFKNPLEYTVGKSNPSKDWNYAQSYYKVGDKRVPWKWRIHFSLPKTPASGNACLTLAFASAHRSHVNVYVNNEQKPIAMVTPSVQGGDALLRDSNHAKYCVEYLDFSTSLLVEGENTITLEQTTTESQSHVMYDYINLELP